MPRPSGGGGLVAVQRGVAEAHAGDVEDGVGRAGREDADLDPDLTCAGHALILSSSVAQRHTADSWISTGCPSCGRPTTREHDPQHEVWVGVATTGTEVAARVDAILTRSPTAGTR